MKNGKGVEELADGTRFEGSFVNDLKDGSFVEKDRNGNILRKGIYNRGRLMGQ
jgi:antitoxin component YwqK of YwqJK toxin-antitoxin module